MKWHGPFDKFTEMQSKRTEVSETKKEDLVQLILYSEEFIVQPARSSLVEMAKAKQVKQTTEFSRKMSWKKALGRPSEKDKTIKNPYVFTSFKGRFEFKTKKGRDGRNEFMCNGNCQSD